MLQVGSGYVLVRGCDYCLDYQSRVSAVYSQSPYSTLETYHLSSSQGHVPRLLNQNLVALCTSQL